MSLSIVVATGVPPCRYLAAPQLMRHARYFSVTLSIKNNKTWESVIRFSAVAL